MEKHFCRHINELEAIVSFLERAVLQLGLDAKTTFFVNMAVEELYTNMVKYNGDGRGDILIGVETDAESVIIQLVDFDSKPFNYADRAEVDIDASLHDRKPGGLGIHLVKRFMDEVSYQYKDRKTSIRLVKNLKTMLEIVQDAPNSIRLSGRLDVVQSEKAFATFIDWVSGPLVSSPGICCFCPK